MEEKNQQEKMAVARQVELLENAFNAIILGMHSYQIG